MTSTFAYEVINLTITFTVTSHAYLFSSSSFLLDVYLQKQKNLIDVLVCLVCRMIFNTHKLFKDLLKHLLLKGQHLTFSTHYFLDVVCKITIFFFNLHCSMLGVICKGVFLCFSVYFLFNLLYFTILYLWIFFFICNNYFSCISSHFDMLYF